MLNLQSLCLWGALILPLGPAVVEYGLEVQVVPLFGTIGEGSGLVFGVVVDILAQGLDGNVGKSQLGIEVILGKGRGLTAGLGAGDTVRDSKFDPR
jgi:hypothetical protein